MLFAFYCFFSDWRGCEWWERDECYLPAVAVVVGIAAGCTTRFLKFTLTLVKDSLLSFDFILAVRLSF